MPWVFGHICSSWRQVALAEHRLWNRIRIVDVEPSYREMLEAVLFRSASAPLDIYMSVVDSLMPVPDIILPQASRISQLHLGTFGDLASFISEFSTPGRMLDSLTKATLFSPHLDIPDGGIHIFGDCPLLRKLDVRLNERRPELLLKTLRGLHVPFSQLTELVLRENSSPHTILCILRETPNLVLCSIVSFSFDPGEHLAFDVVLPHLKYLSLRCEELRMLAQLLCHITPPSLLQLSAVCPYTEDSPDALSSAVLGFVNRSSCHLTHIRMAGNLAPAVDRLHRSVVRIEADSCEFQVDSYLLSSVVQRIACRELTLPYLEEINRPLYLDTSIDLTNMVEDFWSNGEGRNVSKEFRAKRIIANSSAAWEEEFIHWKEEVGLLFNRLSINGGVEFLPQ